MHGQKECGLEVMYYLENGGKTATGMRPNGTRASAAIEVAEVAIGSPPPKGVPG
jgi:hypothetical protein